MTISTTTTSSGPYTAVAQSSFAVTFQSAGPGEIEVLLDDEVVSPSLYTFTRDTDGTGDVVFTTPATGTVLIKSKPSMLQQTAFNRHGAFYPDQINPALDRLAAHDLYLDGRVDEVAERAEDLLELARGPQGFSGTGGYVDLALYGVSPTAIDNAAKIEAAILAEGGGVRLLLPKGTIPLERELRIKKNVMLEGHGSGPTGGTTLTHGAGYSGIRFPYTAGTEDSYDSYLHNLKIVQTAVLSTTAVGNFSTATRTLTITSGTNDYVNGQLVRVDNAGLTHIIPGKRLAISTGTAIATMTNLTYADGNTAVHVGEIIDITGAGLPAGTKVTAVTGTTITLSANATATVTSAVYSVKRPIIATILSGGGTANLVLDVYSEFQDATGVTISHADANVVQERNIHIEQVTFSGPSSGNPMGCNLFQHASSTAGGGDSLNTSSVRFCRFYSAKIGTYIHGYDSNASIFLGCDWSLYSQFGVLDQSLIGNFFIGCHWAFNTGIAVPLPANKTSVVASYFETGTSAPGNSGAASMFACQYMGVRNGWAGMEALTGSFATSPLAVVESVDLREVSSSGGYYVSGTRVVRERQTGTPAAATDLATALTLVNDLRAKLVTHGLIS